MSTLVTTTTTFLDFRSALNAHLEVMLQDVNRLYILNVGKHDLWNTYIESFLDLDIKQEHNCNACRSFIQRYGNLIRINEDGSLTTIWDFDIGQPYNEINDRMKDLLSLSFIRDKFIPYEKELGTEKNLGYRDGNVITWHHLWGNLPLSTIIYSRGELDPLYHDYSTKYQMVKKALMLDEGALRYAIEELPNHRLGSTYVPKLEKLLEVKQIYDDNPRDSLIWVLSNQHPSLSTIANSPAGLLIKNIIEKGENDALREYDRMVAPTNYRITSAPINSKSVDTARDFVERNGFTPSLDRRLMDFSELNINDMLYVYRQKSNNDDPFSSITTKRKKTPNLDNVPSITFDELINTEGMIEVLLTDQLVNKLFSFTTAVNPDSPPMFYWGNHMSYCYKGGFGGAIDERVKDAGGNITAPFRISLMWNNYDDLDLHLYHQMEHIYFGSKSNKANTLHLDVDMNVGTRNLQRNPVENIYSKGRPKDGTYKIVVHNYRHRPGNTYQGSSDDHYVKIVLNDKSYMFYGTNPLTTSKDSVINITIQDGELITITSNLQEIPTSTLVSNETWNLKHNEFHPLLGISHSPAQIKDMNGPGHTFLYIQGTKPNPGDIRGFMVEHLKSEFHHIRRVMEPLSKRPIILDKDEHEYAAGLGFEKGQPTTVIVRTKEGIKQCLI